MESIADAWTSLRNHLEFRGRELNDEVAHYPTPIARCDVQLTKLLEQRARVLQVLRRVIDIGPPTSTPILTPWCQRAAALLASPDAASEDEIEVKLRARLGAALSELPSTGGH